MPQVVREADGLAQDPRTAAGQPGATLVMTADPDEVICHEPGRCAGCGGDLAGAPQAGMERRQVTDLPEDIRALVTEHRLISRRCSCGTVTAAPAPAGVAAPVQYGPRIAAACAYLWHGQFLSRNRTCQAMAELFGVPVSPGAVAGMVTRIAGALGAPLEAIRAAVAAAEVAHFDETGFRVAGKLAWVHSASAGNHALVTVHESAVPRGWTAPGCSPRSPASRSMTRGRRTTPTPSSPGTRCATRTPCESFRP